MAATGGSIEEVGINGRPFSVAADAESGRRLGGYENEHMANGNGSGRLSKTRVGWRAAGLSLEVDDTNGDLEFLQDVADGNEYVPMTITYVSGETYAGIGQITGEIAHQSKSTTAPLTLEGPNKLVKQ